MFPAINESVSSNRWTSELPARGREPVGVPAGRRVGEFNKESICGEGGRQTNTRCRARKNETHTNTHTHARTEIKNEDGDVCLIIYVLFLHLSIFLMLIFLSVVKFILLLFFMHGAWVLASWGSCWYYQVLSYDDGWAGYYYYLYNYMMMDDGDGVHFGSIYSSINY